MAKAKRVTVSPDASTPVKRKAERSVATSLKKVFKATKKASVPKMVEAYRKVVEEHRKGLSDESKYVLDELNLDSWVELANLLSDPMSNTQKDAAEKALSQLGISDSDIFDKVNKDAVAAAEDRAASLVGMKWDGNELVPNPSADAAITESTREGVRKLVVTALTDGQTVEELATSLEDAYLFSDVRAEMIARTELGAAHVNGTLSAWRLSDLVTGKRWLTADDDVDDECSENEDEGVINLDEDFGSGDDGPPAHPNCRCVLVSDLKDEE